MKVIIAGSRTITDVFLAYLAGIIDGEGCIGLYLHQDKNVRFGFRFEARICVVSTNIKLLEFLKKTTGEGNIYSQHTKNKKWKKASRWEICPNSIRRLLPNLLPYLVIKRKQSRLLLAYLELAKPGKHTSDKNRYIMEQIHKKIKLLNKRGRK